MSTTANFEQMSNEELRLQMETFGMPKVPITASTRNILIKRLHNHVNGTGKPSTPSKAARRETMHVVKYSSDDDSDRDAAKEKLKKKMENHKNARRQTMGGAALSPAPAPAPVVAPILEKPSRKSMRATPTKTTTRDSEIVPPSKSRMTTIPMTIEDSDEDDESLVVLRKKITTVDRRSKSKTPTLAKSDLVTTSYKQYVAAAKPPTSTLQEEDPIDLLDDEEEEEERPSDLEEEVPVSRYTSRRFEVNEPKATKYSPVKPMSIRISPLRRTTTGDGTFRYEGTSSTYTRPSLAPTSYTSSYNANRYGTSSAAATGSGGSGAVDGTGDGDEFPYLREFSKRLSTLKAEPLYKRNVPLTTSSTSRTSTTAYSSTSSRSSNYRPMLQRESHWYDPLMLFLRNLEDRYALKKKILILLAILVFIFVLVMIWY